MHCRHFAQGATLSPSDQLLVTKWREKKVDPVCMSHICPTYVPYNTESIAAMSRWTLFVCPVYVPYMSHICPIYFPYISHIYFPYMSHIYVPYMSHMYMAVAIRPVASDSVEQKVRPSFRVPDEYLTCTERVPDECT